MSMVLTGSLAVSTSSHGARFTVYFPKGILEQHDYLCFNEQQCFYFVLYVVKLLVPELS